MILSPFSLALRYSLVGLGALATLSLVHFGRSSSFSCGELCRYAMGVLPNVAAAIAIPFVLLSIWADQKKDASYPAARRAFFGVSLATGVALIGWEAVQQSSRALVYDVHDIGATVVGLCLGGLLFALVTPRFSSPRTPP